MQSLKELKTSLGDNERLQEEELLRLLHVSLRVEIPPKSSVENGAQVFESSDNFYVLIVYDTGLDEKFGWKPKTISLVLFILSSKKLSSHHAITSKEKNTFQLITFLAGKHFAAKILLPIDY